MKALQKSDKLHIIDQSTLKQAQQNEDRHGVEAARKIRNSKYKRHHNASTSFDLMTLITASRGAKVLKSRAHYRKGATLLTRPRFSGITKRGKTRENSKKKKSRLKKLVLKYRLQKTSKEDHHEKKQQDGHMDNEIDIPTSNNSKKLFTTEATMLQSSEITSTTQHLHRKLTTVTNILDNLTLQEPVKSPTKSIHSRRFREYCDNCTTPDLANLSTDILRELDRFQKRAYAKNPIKANAHRRFVVGFREIQNHLRINKLKFVLIATDCEKCTLEGGIDETIEAIKDSCKSLEVPCAFALPRRAMAYALNKKGNVSGVGILDPDGVREKFAQLLSALDIARVQYSNFI